LHILLIHQAFTTLDEPGGTRHYELAGHLAAAGHRVTVIASPISYLTGHPVGPAAPRPSVADDPQGVRILRVYTYPGLHRSFGRRVLIFFSFMFSSFFVGLKVKDVDLVWGTSPPIFQGLTAWALARLKRRPFLFEVRDLWPAFAVAIGVLKNRLAIRLAESLERFLYRRADRIIVNSPGFLEPVRRLGGREPVVIPNGVDVGMFHPQADGREFRDRWNLGDRFVAMYAGAHGVSNNLGILLEAARLLLDEPRVAVVLVGDGMEKPALLAKATALRLTNLTFVPSLPKNEMGRALAAADACIGILKPIPLYATVYPNKIFDYLAAGRPVILAMQGVILDLVEQAGAGIPVPPGDAPALAQAVRRLAADPQQARRLGLAGRAFVETHYDRRKLAGELIRIIQPMEKP